MSSHETQSFFTPPVHSSHDEVILPSSYNLSQVLLKRSQTSHLFVPIRPMQYLAIIEADVFWFIDSMAYAVQDGEGGRLITVSWHPQLPPSERDSLEQPMPSTVTYYGANHEAVQNRLRSEFLQAMQLIDQRYRQTLPAGQGVRILPFRSPTTVDSTH